MPRLKTESEVATMAYLREHTDIPVPAVYHHDSNPYNRLGGEYILMSKVCHPVASALTRFPITCMPTGTWNTPRQDFPLVGLQ